MGSLAGHKFSEPADISRDHMADSWFASRICDCHLTRFHCRPSQLDSSARTFLDQHKHECLASKWWPLENVICEAGSFGLLCKCGAWHEMSNVWVEQAKRPMWLGHGRGPQLSTCEANANGSHYDAEPPDAPNLLLGKPDKRDTLVGRLHEINRVGNAVESREYERQLAVAGGDSCKRRGVPLSYEYLAKVANLRGQFQKVSNKILNEMGVSTYETWSYHANIH